MHRATETFHAGDRTITAGDLLDDNDPLVKACEVYFEPADAATSGAKRTPARRAAQAKKSEEKNK